MELTPLPGPPPKPPSRPGATSKPPAPNRTAPTVGTRSSRPRKAPYSASRWGLAATFGATTFAASYAIQRLWALGTAEPDPTVAILLGHTPYYWRCALALLHAAIIVPIVGFAIDDDTAIPILRWAPLWIPSIVLPLALAMVGFP